MLTPQVQIDSLEVDSIYTFKVIAINEVGESEPALIDVRTRGKFRATWNRSIDYKNGEENGYAEKYSLWIDTDEPLNKYEIYSGPDTVHVFVVDYEPCIKVKAIDSAGNQSDFSKTVCKED